MTKQLISVSAAQTAKVVALLWVVFTIPFVIFMAIAIGASDAPRKPSVGFLLLFPIIYGVLGYLFTLLGAWCYNLIAKRVGGIEFQTVEVKDAQQGVGQQE